MTVARLGFSGANTKVLEAVLDKKAYGWSPEEMHFQHPHLALSQIHTALAYNYENRKKLDEQIERDYLDARQLAAGVSDPAFRQKLLALKNPKRTSACICRAAEPHYSDPTKRAAAVRTATK